jgi:hypothetical protein
LTAIVQQHNYAVKLILAVKPDTSGSGDIRIPPDGVKVSNRSVTEKFLPVLLNLNLVSKHNISNVNH